jgi:hypothetical protein
MDLSAHIPPTALNWTLKDRLVTWPRIHCLERLGRKSDAVLFNHTTVVRFLGELMRQTPMVLCVDVALPLPQRYS